MKYCQYCNTRAETEECGEFLTCADCGSNLGPKQSSVGIMFR